MKNHKRSRLLTTMVLAAAMCMAFGSQALAVGNLGSAFNRSSAGSTAFKPQLRPMAGEPDAGQSAPAPPVKVNSLAPVGQSTNWVLRLQWSFRVLLNQLPRR